jgi:hypothetical protein
MAGSAGQLPDFEGAALHACDLVLARDPRIGKVPKRRTPKVKKHRGLADKVASVVRKPKTLPHFLMVLHRGGFPDGS